MRRKFRTKSKFFTLRGTIATATCGAMLFGAIGAGILLAPTAQTPAAADPPREQPDNRELEPATTVQADSDSARGDDASAGDASGVVAGPSVGGSAQGISFPEQADPEESVTVIVRTEPRAWWDFDGAVKRIEEAVEEQAKDESHDNRKVEVVREYKTAFNGAAVSVPRWAVTTVQQTRGVDTAFIEGSYSVPVTPQGAVESGSVFDWENGSSLAMTGADTVAKAGEGMLISIIDTGLDIGHEAFQGKLDAKTVHMSEAGAEEARQLTGTPGRYVSNKIPFAYDYADKDNNVDPAGASTDLSHGTHVAGIAAANAGDKIRGTAPNAQIMVQKVFDSLDGRATDSSLLAALDDAAKIKPDVINLSLGSDSGFSEERSGVFNEVYDKLRQNGVLVVAAAGNSEHAGVGNPSGTNLPSAEDPDYGVIASPSSLTESLAIASIDNSDVRPYFLAADGTRVHFVSGSSEDGSEVVPFTALADGKYSYIDGGEGQFAVVEKAMNAHTAAGGDPAKTIVVTRRGGEEHGELLTFQDKLYAASGVSAAGVLFVDNVESDVLLIPSLTNGSLPAALVSKKAGEALLAAADKTLTIDAGQLDVPSKTYQASYFSSMGVTPELDLKPDVAAPGGKIFSAMPGGQYDQMSGTSMASPQIAGILALIKERIKNDPKYAGVEGADLVTLASQILMNTAEPVLNPKSKTPYTPRKQGAGIAQVPQALATPVSLSVVGTDHPERPSASLGDSVKGAFAFTVVATNRSDKAVTYELDAQSLSDRIADGRFQADTVKWGASGVKASFGGAAQGTRLTVPANGTAEFTVSLQAGKEFFTANAAAKHGTFLDGFLRLTAKNQPSLTVPYLGFVGSWADVPVFDEKLVSGDAKRYGSVLANRNNGIPLGVNPLDTAAMAAFKDDTSVIRPERSVLSPTRYASAPTSAQTVTGLLRNVDTLDYEFVREADQKVVKKYSYEEVAQSSFSPQTGFMLYAEARLPFYPIISAFDEKNTELEPGKYTLVQTATTSGKKKSTQTQEFSFQYDNQGPKIESVERVGAGDDAVLKLTVSDESYLASIDFQEYEGAGYFHRVLAGDPTRTDENGRQVYELQIPVSEIRKGWIDTEAAIGTNRDFQSTVVLYAWDYGLNPTLLPKVTMFDGPVTGIEITGEGVSLAPEQTLQLDATVKPENAVAHTVEWSSSDSSVVSVSETGLATGVAAGTAEISARVQGTDFVSTVSVTVAEIDEKTGIVLSPSTLNIGEGAQAKLQALLAPSLREAKAPVKWESSDKSIASVDKTGTVSAHTRGEVTITATVTGPKKSFTAQTAVLVQQPDYADYVIENGELLGYIGSRTVVDVPVGVTSIAEGAFANGSMTSVTIPYTVTSIGSHAFAAMPALQQVKIQDGEEGAPSSRLTELGDDVFNRSTRLRAANLPDSVSKMGERVFQDTLIEEITIPSHLKELPANTFSGAIALHKVTFTEGLEKIGARAFAVTRSLTEAKLPSTLREIGDAGFITSGLTELDLPKKTVSVGHSAFAGNPLRSVNLSAVESIGPQAFSQTKIEHLVLPDSVTSVGEGAFVQISDLIDVTIGRNIPADQLTGVFDMQTTWVANPRLERFIVPGNVKHYSEREGMLYDKAGKKLFSMPRAHVNGGTLKILDGTTEVADMAVVGANASVLQLPEGLERIGFNAFAGSAFESLTTPDSLKVIDRHAFTSNSRLKSVEFTQVKTLGAYAFAYAGVLKDVSLGSLESIGDYAFEQNHALTEITIPDSVKSIGTSAFLNSTNLRKVHLGSGVTELGEAVFTGIPGLTELTIAEGNPAFTSDENVLYGRDGDELSLLLYLPTKKDKEYNVLDGTVRIGEQAFRGNEALERVVLPEGLLDLSVGSFNSLPNLSEVVFPDSLRKVDGIYFAPKLRKFEFGTKIEEFGSFWSMGTDLEHLLVRGASGAAFTDAFGLGNVPLKTAYFGPGMAEVNYTMDVPKVLVIAGDLKQLKLDANWTVTPETRIYAPADSIGWQTATDAIAEAGIIRPKLLQPYETLAVQIEAEEPESGETTINAKGIGGVTAIGDESAPYEFRFITYGEEGQAEVLQDWSQSAKYSGTPAAGTVVTVEVRDATLLTATNSWTAGQAAPVVTKQPVNASAEVGKSATFEATAAGQPEPTVQWQMKRPGAAWADVQGATSNLLEVADTTTAISGTRYRAVFTNSLGTAQSDEAVLVVTETGGETPGTPGEPGDDKEPTEAPATPDITAENPGLVQLVAQNDHEFELALDVNHADKWVGVTVHSDPQFLGWQRSSSDARIKVQVPAELKGQHHLSVVDRDGKLLGVVAIDLGKSGGSTGGGNGEEPVKPQKPGEEGSKDPSEQGGKPSGGADQHQAGKASGQLAEGGSQLPTAGIAFLALSAILGLAAVTAGVARQRDKKRELTS